MHIKEITKYNFILNECVSREKDSIIHIDGENMKMYNIWGRKYGHIYGKKYSFFYLILLFSEIYQ